MKTTAKTKLDRKTNKKCQGHNKLNIVPVQWVARFENKTRSKRNTQGKELNTMNTHTHKKFSTTDKLIKRRRKKAHALQDSESKQFG